MTSRQGLQQAHAHLTAAHAALTNALHFLAEDPGVDLDTAAARSTLSLVASTRNTADHVAHQIHTLQTP